MNFFDSNWYTYMVLPLLIVIARIVDVSIGTVKIIFISKGYRTVPPILGFFEVLVWLLAVTRIFENLDNMICYFAYAFGFALGSYVGILIEEKLALGVQLIRIITHKDASELTEALRRKGFGVTSQKAEGSQGNVGMLYSIVNRKNINEIVNTINIYNPNAFYTIEDIRYVSKQIVNTNLDRTQKRKMFQVGR
jgi:uncharacterized protein YebE (UPF0316 family)